MDNLPEKLLSRIFQELPTKELGALSTVTKKFSRIATPFLYSKCDLADSASRDQHRAVRAILHTLVARPELRPLAQGISVGDWPNCGEAAEGAKHHELSMTAISDVIQCMPSLRNCPNDYQWDVGKGLREPRQSAMTTAILSMLPNLKTVSFNKDPSRWRGGYDNDSDSAIGLVLQLIELSEASQLARSPVMQSVSYISLGGKTKPDDLGWDVDSVFMCLRLPTLKKFVGGGCIDSEWSVNWDGQYDVSNATDLTLFDCGLETLTLQKLLRFCRTLTSFKCLRVCESESRGGFRDYTYSYAGVHHDLSRHQESLHSLHLHAKACGHPNCWSHRPVESFAALHNLKFLEVDEDALFGIQEAFERPFGEILSANLEYMVIKGEPEVPQRDVFEEVMKALVLGRLHATFEVQDGCITEAESMLTCYSNIKLEEITDRYQVEKRVICSFLIYKREDGTSEA